LRNSLNEMLLSTTEFAPSFLYDLDASVWLLGYQTLKVCFGIVFISWFLAYDGDTCLIWERYRCKTRLMSNFPATFFISHISTFCVTCCLKCM
jgi:hypothetical protein